MIARDKFFYLSEIFQKSAVAERLQPAPAYPHVGLVINTFVKTRKLTASKFSFSFLLLYLYLRNEDESSVISRLNNGGAF